MNKPWSNQKHKLSADLPSRQYIIDLVRGIPNLRNRSLIILCYLCGCRISELTRKYPGETGILKKHVYDDIVANKPVLNVWLINRKNRRTKQKRIPIPLDRESELIGLLRPFLDGFDDPDAPLFDIGWERARRIIREETGWGAHMLRHLRITHLVQMYDLNPAAIRRLSGWTNLIPFSSYEHLRVDDLVY